MDGDRPLCTLPTYPPNHPPTSLADLPFLYSKLLGGTTLCGSLVPWAVASVGLIHACTMPSYRSLMRRQENDGCFRLSLKKCHVNTASQDMQGVEIARVREKGENSAVKIGKKKRTKKKMTVF